MYHSTLKGEKLTSNISIIKKNYQDSSKTLYLKTKKLVRES
jgi:hypothetical protein